MVKNLGQLRAFLGHILGLKTKNIIDNQLLIIP